MKLLKKIAPIVIAGLMLGVPVAAVADLSTWKADFANGNIVVSSSSSVGAQDIAAAVDIAGVLGIQAIPVTGAVGESLYIKQAGDVLNYADDLDEMAPAGLDKSDLSTILADGTFDENEGDTSNNIDYDQVLEFDPDGAVTLTLNLDIDDDDTNEAAGTYLFFDSGDPIYGYTITFDDDVEWTEGEVDDEFEGATITILGKEYTITEATEDDDALETLELMGGAVYATQGEYTTKTYTVGGKTYEIEVMIISDDDLSAKFKINGKASDAMLVGDTWEIEDGVEIGVDEVMPNEGSEAAGVDMTSFWLGARKITLTDGGDVEINDEDIDDYTVNVVFTDVEDVGLTAIEIEVEPDDDMWLNVGEKWTDPVFGAFELDYKELQKKTETITLDVSGNPGKLTFKNNAGDTIEVPITEDEGATFDVAFGDDDKFINADLADGEGCANDGATLRNIGMAFTDLDSCAVTDGATLDAGECDGFLFMVLSDAGEARIYSIRDIVSGAGGTVEIKDEQNGGETIDDDASCDSGDTVNIAGMGAVAFDCETDADVFEFEDIDLDNSADWETSLGGIIHPTYAADAVIFNIEDPQAVTDTWEVHDDDGDDDMVIADTDGLNFMDIEKDSDTEIAVDNANWGIIYTNKDSDDDNDYTIEYPEEIDDDTGVAAKIYITELLGEGTSTGGGKTYYTDAEATTVFAGKPLISIGGSAINKISATLLGLTYPTYGTDAAWVTPTKVDAAGKGIIKIISSPTVGSVAMLVAGYEGSDTGVLGTILKEGITPALNGTSALINTIGKAVISA